MFDCTRSKNINKANKIGKENTKEKEKTEHWQKKKIMQEKEKVYIHKDKGFKTKFQKISKFKTIIQ